MIHKFLRKPLSPYVGGIIIGCLQSVSLLTVGKMLGLSSSYAALVARIFNFLGESFSFPYIAKYLNEIGTWQLSIALGIVGGSYLSFKIRKSHFQEIDPFWNVLGFKKKSVYLNSFLGGIFLVFGARLVGGCTSGHGLSGIATLSIGSMITLSGLFVTAVIAFWFLRKMRKT